jgi:hypothetical protein
MRKFPTCVFAGIFSLAVRAADTGVPPRVAGTDYPVHDRAMPRSSLPPSFQQTK